MSAEKELVRPYWIPPDLDFDALPEEMRVAALEIIAPAYRELVVDAPTAIERGIGKSIAFLLWEELFDEFELTRSIDFHKIHERRMVSPEKAETRAKLLDSLLRKVGARLKLTNVLDRLRSRRERGATSYGFDKLRNGGGPA
jgi:hypothetical protein